MKSALLFPIPLAVLIVLVALLPAGSGAALRYEHSLILEGQLWRLLTAHVLHLGWEHLLINLTALAAIWAMFQRFVTARIWWLATLACALGVSVGLLLFDAYISWYVGLSGVLHGLFVTGALFLPRKYWRHARLLLAALGIKLLAEQLGYTVTALSSQAVLGAHMYGAFAGLLAGWAAGGEALAGPEVRSPRTTRRQRAQAAQRAGAAGVTGGTAGGTAGSKAGSTGPGRSGKSTDDGN